MPEGTARRRSSFGPVALSGLAAAALAAVASAKPWLDVGTAGREQAGFETPDAGATFPLASAVSLLLLAGWGVLLVTRGRVRRGFAVVCAVAGLGLAVCVVVAHQTMHLDAAATALDEVGRRRFTGWYWTAGVAALVALVAGVLAVRHVGTWPEMGTRYDAPAAAAESGSSSPSLDTDRDVWLALDEGHDPTLGRRAAEADQDPPSDPPEGPPR